MVRVLLLLVACATVNAALSSRVWRASNAGLPAVWPESTVDELAMRSASGICLSGGGSRSFVVSLGYLRALLDIGVLNRTRYLVGTSGGAWATTVFTFASRDAGFAADDDALLGSIVAPSELRLVNLRELNATCARSAATANFVTKVAGGIVTHGLDGAWINAVEEIYLRAFGIDPGAYTAWSAATIADAIARNPGLSAAGARFVVPRDSSRPLPILSASLLGPKAMVPFELASRAYATLEVSALAAGVPLVRNVTYTRKKPLMKATTEQRQVGGLVEPWAALAPNGASPIDAGGLNDTVQLSLSSNGSSVLSGLTVGVATGVASYAPGDVVSSWSSLTAGLGYDELYWGPRTADEASASATAPAAAETFVFGDGGNVVNPNLISLIQRGVQKILVCANFNVPLSPRSKWDPAVRVPTAADIDNDIPAFFGVDVAKPTSAGYYLSNNQIFQSADFAEVATALQDAQAQGAGAIATTPLQTVANDWWGIKAGMQLNITWLYLSRAAEWEAALPQEVFAEAVNPSDPNCTDPTVLPTKGEFKHFPHYDTGSQIVQTNAMANLLANLAGWTVHANAHLLREALL